MTFMRQVFHVILSGTLRLRSGQAPWSEGSRFPNLYTALSQQRDTSLLVALRMTLMVRFPRRSAELTPKPSKKVAEELSLLVKVIFFKSFF